MIDERQVFERVMRGFVPPDDSFERLVNRRDRKRRNKRITAGALGLAVGLAAVLIGSSLIRSDQSVPVQPAPTGEQGPVLREGEVLVEGNGLGRVDALDPSTGDQRTLVKCKDPCVWIPLHAISADGRWLAYEVWTCLGALPCESEAGIWVTNALGEDRQLAQGCAWPNSCHPQVWAWSPQGATLAVYEGGDVSKLFTIDPQTGDRTTLATTDVEVSTIAWSPDGTSVVYAATGLLQSVDLGSGKTTLLTDLVRNVGSVGWSPDGTQLVLSEFLAGRNRILVMNADGSDLRVLVDLGDQVVQGAPRGPGPPAWSPDGTRIAYVSTPATGPNGAHSFEVWVIGTDGSEPTRLFHLDCCVEDWDGPAWSPDGRRIAFFDDIDVDFGTWLVVNADGTGEPAEIDELEVESWGSDA
jgi:dipeptidyl aminopeptidase/acylaminoacyl peptidase